MTENKLFGVNDGENELDKDVLIDAVDLATLPRVMLDWIDQNSQAIIMLYDNSGVLRFVSQSVQSILNIERKQLIGKYWQETFVNLDKNFSKTSHELQHLKVSMKNQAQQIIWFHATISPIVYNNEKIYIISLLDISHNKKLEELIIQSEKLSVAGQLAAGIVHEIRNPLTSLKGFLQLLNAGVDAKDAYYKIMIDEINKIETITSELLLIAKPMTADKQRESIRSMIKEVITLLQSEARMNQIHLMSENIVDQCILCNRTQIKQALINLIKNAIEAVEAHSTIIITTSTINNEFLLVDIIDEGPGVPEDMIDKISEPFYTTKEEGTGLGLMITEKILNEHDGFLKIMKNRVKGSTFRLKFPIDQLQ